MSHPLPNTIRVASRTMRFRGLLTKTLLPGIATTLARQTLMLHGALQRGRSIVQAIHPFEVLLAWPRARVMMLGDSTGVGIGCLHAGQTGKRQHWRVSGADTAFFVVDDLAHQARDALAGERSASLWRGVH